VQEALDLDEVPVGVAQKAVVDVVPRIGGGYLFEGNATLAQVLEPFIDGGRDESKYGTVSIGC
jgi:hypothetical protein